MCYVVIPTCAYKLLSCRSAVYNHPDRVVCLCVVQRSLYLAEGGRLTRLDPVELRRRQAVPLPAVQSGSRWFSDGGSLCSMAPQQDVSHTVHYRRPRPTAVEMSSFLEVFL